MLPFIKSFLLLPSIFFSGLDSLANNNSITTALQMIYLFSLLALFASFAKHKTCHQPTTQIFRSG